MLLAISFLYLLAECFVYGRLYRLLVCKRKVQSISLFGFILDVLNFCDFIVSSDFNRCIVIFKLHLFLLRLTQIMIILNCLLVSIIFN